MKLSRKRLRTAYELLLSASFALGENNPTNFKANVLKLSNVLNQIPDSPDYYTLLDHAFRYLDSLDKNAYLSPDEFPECKPWSIKDFYPKHMDKYLFGSMAERADVLQNSGIKEQVAEGSLLGLWFAMRHHHAFTPFNFNEPTLEHPLFYRVRAEHKQMALAYEAEYARLGDSKRDRARKKAILKIASSYNLHAHDMDAPKYKYNYPKR
ncbi:hypothetical protein FACS189425_08010 [Clostridia bacterium]|nr:hypothetical protein FACS189425_08010 [Clostridia bacterium]